MTMTTKAMERAIREAFPMPEDIRKHANRANYDLHYGPLSGPFEDGSAYSFSESAGIFGEWVDDIGTVYYDDCSGCIMTSEPEGEWFNPETGEYSDSWEDPEDGWEWVEPGEYYIVEPRDIAEALGYRELYSYA